jgi:predicted phage terminase large subunit-like protein
VVIYVTMKISGLSDDEIKLAVEHAHLLSKEDRVELQPLIEEYYRRIERAEASERFLPYVRKVWPEFIAGKHHKIMADAFERVARGELKRLIINMPPRHTKSEFASWLLPAWFLGRFPGKKIIQCSNTQDLAAGFGRKVRDLIMEDEAYQNIFDTALAADSKSKNHWHTSKKGEYFAIGVNGRVTGKGGDIVIIDDPHSEQEAKQAERNPEVFDDVYEWYKAGPRQRLQPGGAIIIVMTRWHKRDLTGRLLKKMIEAEDDAGDHWEIIELPAILDEGEENERSMWPGFWSLKELTATKNEIGIPAWSAQYQQNPTSTVGAIIKSTDWQIWEERRPPPCSYIIQSWDTAFTKTERADYCACTTWGVFDQPHPETGVMTPNVILLDAFKERLDFPTMKKRVKEVYREWHPDTLLIENKGSGISLIQELRLMGIPVEEFTPTRKKKGVSNDKVARANTVVGVFSSGYVWRPDRRFAEEVAVECNEFPNGEHDDYVDSTVQALIRFRAGGFLRTEDDEDEEEDEPPRRVSVGGRRFY